MEVKLSLQYKDDVDSLSKMANHCYLYNLNWEQPQNENTVKNGFLEISISSQGVFKLPNFRLSFLKKA
jgi:hypothetical protein